jgi:hypothetical protein
MEFCPVWCEVLPFRLFYNMHSCLCCLQDWIIQYDPPDDPRVKSWASTLFLCAFLFWFCLWEFHLVCHLARIFYVALLQEYIHRVGRTARGEGAQGRALLFLIPEELGFLRYLKVCLILQQYLASPMNLHHNLPCKCCMLSCIVVGFSAWEGQSSWNCNESVDSGGSFPE